MTKIIFTPDPVLIKKSVPVLKIDKKVKDFIQELKTALVRAKKPKGVGLAAPQIGKLWRIFVTRETQTSPIKVFINPKITWQSKRKISQPPSIKNAKSKAPRFLEGCLSIPGIWGEVKRFQTVKISYQTLTRKINEEKISDFLSTIVQHEMDHLTGILFPTRVLQQKGKLYKLEKNKKDKTYLAEFKI